MEQKSSQIETVEEFEKALRDNVYKSLGEKESGKTIVVKYTQKDIDRVLRPIRKLGDLITWYINATNQHRKRKEKV